MRGKSAADDALRAAATILGAGHRETEAYLRKSGVPAVFLRNGWYLENYTDQLPIYSRNGVIIGAGGDQARDRRGGARLYWRTPR